MPDGGVRRYSALTTRAHRKPASCAWHASRPTLRSIADLAGAPDWQPLFALAWCRVCKRLVRTKPQPKGPNRA